MKTFKLSIAPDGKVTAIYNDAHAAIIAKASRVTVRRASYVVWDHDARGWVADLSLTTPGVKLGPFTLRQDAIDAEVRYLDSLLTKGTLEAPASARA